MVIQWPMTISLLPVFSCRTGYSSILFCLLFFVLLDCWRLLLLLFWYTLTHWHRCESSSPRSKYTNKKRTNARLDSCRTQIKNICSFLLVHKSKRDILLNMENECEWGKTSWCFSKLAKKTVEFRMTRAVKQRYKMKKCTADQTNRQSKIWAMHICVHHCIYHIVWRLQFCSAFTMFGRNELQRCVLRWFVCLFVSLFFPPFCPCQTQRFALWLLFRTVQHINL